MPIKTIIPIFSKVTFLWPGLRCIKLSILKQVGVFYNHSLHFESFRGQGTVVGNYQLS